MWFFFITYSPPNIYKDFKKVFQIEEQMRQMNRRKNLNQNDDNQKSFDKFHVNNNVIINASTKKAKEELISNNDINVEKEIHKNNNNDNNNDNFNIPPFYSVDGFKGENSNFYEQKLSYFDLNDLILNNMSRNSLGIILSISKQVKFKDMLILLISILLQCFTDNYVIANRMESNLKSYFASHGIPVKCFMKKDDLEVIENPKFANALGVSLSELNEALYPFIFKNPQIYEDILSCLCFFPKFKLYKE